MLKRIESIKNIGCFIDNHSPSFQFENLTFIYGDNSYGKTTLCDIFRSLKENKSEYITNRMAIPNPNNDAQYAALNFNLPGTTIETTFTFSGNHWFRQLNELNIFVFDTEFIHRNVFTGFSIERRNDENITQFVLGEESVKTAQEISDLNSELREKNKDIRTIESNEFIGITNLNDFLELSTDENSQIIIERLNQINNNLSQTRYILNNITSVLHRNEPIELAINEDFRTLMDRINDTFNSSLTRIHENANQLVLDHIQNHCNPGVQSEGWLHQGLNLIITDHCPFCGQVLENAQNLIDAYREYFNTSFVQFESSIRQILTSIPREMRNFNFSRIVQNIQYNRDTINSYPELLQRQDFVNLITDLNRSRDPLINQLNEWDQIYNDLEQLILTKIQQKNENIFSSIESLNFEEPLSKIILLNNSIRLYNSALARIQSHITTFKGNLNHAEISERIQDLENSRLSENLKLKRLELNSVCQRYLNLIKERDDIIERVATLDENLRQTQTEYLDLYFTKINDFFSRLGSSNFVIDSGISRRGNMPVIQITASYNGVPITRERLSFFFSESDKRALAFSIFWAKIDSLPEEEKAKCILILDDPVTSFDENRIDRTIRLIEATRSLFRQAIILSHYPNYFKSFFDRITAIDSTIKLLKLTKDNNGSKLDSCYAVDFTETIHQKKYRQIKDFIERRHQNNILGDLRIYFEEEIRNRYWKQIEDFNLSDYQLSDLLTELRDNSIISPDVFSEADSLRLSLNVDHHIWTTKTQDEKIGIASDVLDFIYERL